MKLIELTSSLSPKLSEQIADFETLFDYPLSENSRCSIEHGPDFTAFFAAIGHAKTWVLHSSGGVVAALSSAVRTICIDGKNYKVAYLGDLKVHPRFQFLSRRGPNPKKTHALPIANKPKGSPAGKITRLLQSHLTHDVDLAYCVVMDGTRTTPDVYTGNGRIPEFKPIADLYILRFETATARVFSRPNITMESGFSSYRHLCAKTYCDLAKTELRSTVPPQWFISDEGACGMLEDTRRAKRLYVDSGEELVSAHLSYFFFKNGVAATAILDQALHCAIEQNFPAMFVALSGEQYQALSPHLTRFGFSISKATIYATDPLAAKIPINTSEI